MSIDEGDNLKYTSDLWFSAFLLLKGHTVNNFIQIGRGRAKFGFDLTDEQWKAYKLEFGKSEVMKYKAAFEQLKDYCY